MIVDIHYIVIRMPHSWAVSPRRHIFSAVFDSNLALRFSFGDRVVMRVEIGLHDVVYDGGTLGIMF